MLRHERQKKMVNYCYLGKEGIYEIFNRRSSKKI